MAISMKDLDSAFQGAGQKAGLEIWRIENFAPVSVPSSSHGKFFTGDSYIILKTTALKSGALRHDIHYWLGKDTSQDEAGTAAIKTVELDAVLGGRAVQYREVQGHETEKFLSYFKPCIIPQEGGVASGFTHAEINEQEHVTRLFVCKGKHIVRVKEITFARSSLNHDDIFILDTKSKIYQFNGSNSSIQERAKALEVVQHIKDTYHEGKCDMGVVEDGRLMADAEAGEFWGFFGGFAPLPKRAAASEDDKKADPSDAKLLSVNEEETVPVEADSLSRGLLETQKCYLLDCGSDIYVWLGKGTNIEQRKKATSAAEDLLHSSDRPHSLITRVMEGFETIVFKSKFDEWPDIAKAAAAEDGRSKIAALIKQKGFDAGAKKVAAPREEPEPHIDCTGALQVWRINGKEKTSLSASEQSKFYSGDCYIFHYTYAGEDCEECLIGTWFGKKSIKEDRTTATTIVCKMNEAMKWQAIMAQFYEGKEPLLFFCIFQSFVVYKGGLSTGYKNYLTENSLDDDTYSEDATTLFRVQGTGPENMQSIQVDPVASSLNSSYCYILLGGDSVFAWFGSSTATEDQELVERQLDVIRPNVQHRPQKEGVESEQFWNLLGGKAEYSRQKLPKTPESDPNLFACTFEKGNFKVSEIFNFSQDDFMTEDVFIMDCGSDIFVWTGQQVDLKTRSRALEIAEKFIDQDVLMEKLSREMPVYIISEGREPPFFTRFIKWDYAKSVMHGNSFQRRLTILKNGGAPTPNKPKRRPVSSYGGRSVATDNSQRSRSMSSSPDRVRVRGRSPAFNALAANFENAATRNLSTPPPAVAKLYPKSTTDSARPNYKSAGIAALTASFDRPRDFLIPKSLKVGSENNKPKPGEGSGESPGAAEPVDDESIPKFPYEQLTIGSSNPVTEIEIDITKREAYLSTEEFQEKFGISKAAFYKLPKWKQNKLKTALKLF